MFRSWFGRTFLRHSGTEGGPRSRSCGGRNATCRGYQRTLAHVSRVGDPQNELAISSLEFLLVTSRGMPHPSFSCVGGSAKLEIPLRVLSAHRRYIVRCGRTTEVVQVGCHLTPAPVSCR